MDQIPVARFDCHDFAPEERLEAFQRVTASIYDVQPLGEPRAFQVQAVGYHVGDLVFTDLRCGAARFQRRRRHLRGDKQDFLVLQVQHSGEELLVMQHGITRLLPGNIYLRDWAYPFESIADSMHINSILIPRHLFEARDVFSADNPVLSWSRSEPEGRTLWKLWSLMVTEFEQVGPITADALARGMLSFLDGLINLDGNRQASTPSSLRTMERYLVQQLRTDTRAEDLARRFNMSRAKVFRLFKPHGGVKRYIDRMRLDRCLAELKSADPKRTTVSHVAAGWGYLDASDFRRRFRRQFGVSPSQVLGSAYRSQTDLERDPERALVSGALRRSFQTWFRNASKPKTYRAD